MNDLKGHNIFCQLYIVRCSEDRHHPDKRHVRVVDTDPADSDVTITLMGRDGIDATDIQSTAAYVSADGQVSIAGRAAGVIQRQIVNGDNPATTDVTETDFSGCEYGKLTPAEPGGHGLFVQDVRFEFGDGVDLHINLARRQACQHIRHEDGGASMTISPLSTGDEINLVRLFVTPADDALIERSATSRRR